MRRKMSSGEGSDERVVLLLGQSLLVTGVGAGLGACTGLRVLRAVTWPEAAALLAGRTPNVLIFDLGAPFRNELLALLCTNPGLVLVGLDVERNRAVRLAGQEMPGLTLAQLKEIVAPSSQEHLF